MEEVLHWVMTGAWALLVTAAAPPGPAVPIHGCPPEAAARLQPDRGTRGPLRLSRIVCVPFRFGSGPMTLSPDGTAVVRWQQGAPAPIEIAAVDRPAPISVPNRVTFRNLAGLSERGMSPDALAWSRDSQSLWSVRQPTANPSGFALAGLSPIAIGRDGTIRALPPLRHPAGPLDAIMWVGGDGLAIVMFGWRGSYYRPEHADPAPTLAMVDARRGRLLADLRAARIPGLHANMRVSLLMAAGAAAAILPDGRIRAVIQFKGWAEPRPPGDRRPRVVHPGLWLVWTQSERLRILPEPYPGDPGDWTTLSPDGSKLLIVRPLQPAGGVIEECYGRCRPSPPPAPVDGTIAELIDAANGRVLWRLPARAAQYWNQNVPAAISRDGRFALVSIPPAGAGPQIALIDMRNGRILQRLMPFSGGSYAPSFGFTADGRRAWGASGNLIYFYDFGGA